MVSSLPRTRPRRLALQITSILDLRRRQRTGYYLGLVLAVLLLIRKSEYTCSELTCRFNITTSPAFPILASSPSINPLALPDNLDQVISGRVIDDIINIFFDYVSFYSSE